MALGLRLPLYRVVQFRSHLTTLTQTSVLELFYLLRTGLLNWPPFMKVPLQNQRSSADAIMTHFNVNINLYAHLLISITNRISVFHFNDSFSGGCTKLLMVNLLRIYNRV